GKGHPECTVGVTSLSVLAFLGAGYTQLSKDEFPDPQRPGQMLKFGEVVKKGLQYLLGVQDPEKCVNTHHTKVMYDHAIAALALSEAYGMTASLPLKEPAQKALDFLIAAQNPGKGWRYTAKSGDSDTSVTGWAVMALKSADLADLNFPREAAYAGAVAWLNDVTSKDGYMPVGYAALPGAGGEPHPTMTAVGVYSRIVLQKRKSEPALAGANLLAADLPEANLNRIDFNYWYFGTAALFQYDGPDGPLWKKWNEPLKNALVPTQKTAQDGCANGSWSSLSRWGDQGGRVWATAINALTLETYYRYAKIFPSPVSK